MVERAARNPSDHLKEMMAKLYHVPITDIFLSIQETKRLKKKIKNQEGKTKKDNKKEENE